MQMAMKMGTRIEYAIKFFLSQVAFNEEVALYTQGSGEDGGDLAQFLPRVCMNFNCGADSAECSTASKL